MPAPSPKWSTVCTIKAYYEKLGLLVTAKGEDKLEDTTSNVAKALGLEV